LRQISNYSETIVDYLGVTSLTTAPYDVHTCCELGKRFEVGTGVEVNLKLACKLYTRAAKNGDLDAMNRMGLMYDQGKEIPQDHKEALKLFQTASKAGNIPATYNLAMMYYDGDHIEKNIPEALRLLRLAEEKGFSEAMNTLGIMYLKGVGVPINNEKAMKYFKKGFNKGNVKALFNLALVYEINAIYDLKMKYTNGNYEEVNLTEAIRLLDIAIRFNSVKAPEEKIICEARLRNLNR